MIILDTNVISGLMSPKPEPLILEWFNKHDLEYLWLTSISVMEIELGIELLPNGIKKKNLRSSFNDMLRQQFYNRIIGFDEKAALLAGELAANNEKNGINKDIRDMQIAGIAKSNRALLATRNEKDFLNCGIEILNPWKS